MNILLVEDEEPILRLVSIMLERAGYHVFAATRPDAALQLLIDTDETFDLLITDVIMPGMNGRELSERIREHSPDIACLFVSGYTADVIGDQQRTGADYHFLQKPFTMKQLIETVRQVCPAA